MALHNMTQAAKLVGLSRAHFYNKYVNKGLLTISKDSKDSPVVDTSELVRVFGALHVDSTKYVNTIHDLTPVKDNEINLLHDIIKDKDKQIEALRVDKDLHIKDLQTALLLIQDKSNVYVKPKQKIVWPWVVVAVVSVCGIAILGVLYFPYSSKVPVPVPVQRPVPTSTPPAIPHVKAMPETPSKDPFESPAAVLNAN